MAGLTPEPFSWTQENLRALRALVDRLGELASERADAAERLKEQPPEQPHASEGDKE